MNNQQSTRPEADAHLGGVLDLNERNWLPRHCRGDEQAFEQLLLAYRNLVYNFLYRYGIDQHNRDDLFQDIFLKIHQSAPSYRPSWPLRPWVFTIAANTLRNHVRDQKRFRQFFTTDELPDPPDPLPRAEDIAIIAETKAWLDDAIMRLPFSQREVLVLVALESLPLKEVAAILRVSQNTVKTRLRRARLKLADMLAAHEGTEQSPGDSDD